MVWYRWNRRDVTHAYMKTDVKLSHYAEDTVHFVHRLGLVQNPRYEIRFTRVRRSRACDDVFSRRVWIRWENEIVTYLIADATMSKNV